MVFSENLNLLSIEKIDKLKHVPEVSEAISNGIYVEKEFSNYKKAKGCGKDFKGT